MKDLALVEIKPDDFGIEKHKGMQIEQSFLPKITEYNGLQKVYAQLLEKKIDFDTCEQASETRKKLSKVRTGIAKIHKTEKAYYLAAGRFVDAIKNKLTEPIIQMEDKLKEIETYFEKQEEERLNKLQNDRMQILKPFVDDDFERELITFSEEEFTDFVAVKKMAFERKIEQERKENLYRKRLQNLSSFNFPLLIDMLNTETTEEEYQNLIKEAEYKKAEIEKLAKLKKDREDQIKLYWNYFMPENNISLELYDDMQWEMIMNNVQLEKKKDEDEKMRIKLENERLRKEKEEAEAKAKKEREELEAKARKEKEEAEAKAKKEREGRRKLEAQLEAKKKEEAEAKKKEEAEAKAKKEAERIAALAPEKEKIEKWIDSFSHPSINIFELSPDSEKIVNDILSKFEAFKNWAKQQKETIK